MWYEDSVTYQAILHEGELRQARKIILMLGTERFGAPKAHLKKILEQIKDLRRLIKLEIRVLYADGWVELLAPTPRSRPKKEKN